MKNIPLIAVLASVAVTFPVRADDARRTALAEELISIMRLEGQTNAPKDVWQKIKPDFVKAYSEVYTEEELSGIIAFYNSPVGQALLTKGAEVAKRVLQTQSKAFQEMAQKSQAEHFDSQCLRRINSLGNAIRLYAGDHGGALPKTVTETIGSYLPDLPNEREELVSPFALDANSSSYELVNPGAKLSELQPDAILIRCKFKSPAGRRSIYRANGKTEMAEDK